MMRTQQPRAGLQWKVSASSHLLGRRYNFTLSPPDLHSVFQVAEPASGQARAGLPRSCSMKRCNCPSAIGFERKTSAPSLETRETVSEEAPPVITMTGNGGDMLFACRTTAHPLIGRL